MRFLIHDGWWAGPAPQRSAAYPPQIVGAGRGKPKCGLLRTARQPICGVPAANRQGGEGACSGLSFTILKKIEGDTHFSKILLIFHTESSTLFGRKYRFFKNFEKILRFLKIKNWRSFWHFFQILKIPPFILIYKKGHKGAWHICSAAAAQRRRKCGRLRRPPAAATLRHPSLRSGPLWNHMWTLVSAYFLHLKFRSIGTEKIILQKRDWQRSIFPVQCSLLAESVEWPTGLCSVSGIE